MSQRETPLAAIARLVDYLSHEEKHYRELESLGAAPDGHIFHSVREVRDWLKTARSATVVPFGKLRD